MPLGQVRHDLMAMLLFVFRVDTYGINLVFVEAGFFWVVVKAFAHILGFPHINNIMRPLFGAFFLVATGEDRPQAHGGTWYRMTAP